jgi:hypothetical protein
MKTNGIIARSLLALVGMLALMPGCATIMHGTTQSIGISSTPTGASVSVDNISHGQTPVVTPLSRKDNHIVKVEFAGYQPFEATVTRSVSGWVVGNLVFGGLIGLGVDAISGGLYTLGPEQITATLISSPQPTVALQGEQQPVVPPQPGAAQQGEQQSITPPQPVASLPSVPQRVEQPSVTPPAFVPQPVPQQVEHQLVAPLPQQERKATLDVVQLQSRYNASRLFLRPDTGAERLSMVYAGVTLKVIENRGSWLYIESPPPDDRRGWVLREWLQ